VAASYIPQVIRIVNDRRGTAGISGWYIVLLTISATAHLAARLDNYSSSSAWKCFRQGELQGFDAFSSLVVYLQALVHWVAAIILLGVYAAFRNDTYQTGSPSTTATLAIVITHAAILLPCALWLLKQLTEEEDNVFTVVLHAFYAIPVQTTGLLTSLLAFIPQIKLMLAQPRDGLPVHPCNLSTLGLGLQVIAWICLACSQAVRMRPLPTTPPPPDMPNLFPPIPPWSMKWWSEILFGGGQAAGWLALAGSQLVVLCVALRLGATGDRQIQLKLL
jgi:hypothetical protein